MSQAFPISPKKQFLSYQYMIIFYLKPLNILHLINLNYLFKYQEYMVFFMIKFLSQHYYSKTHLTYQLQSFSEFISFKYFFEYLNYFLLQHVWRPEFIVFYHFDRLNYPRSPFYFFEQNFFRIRKFFRILLHQTIIMKFFNFLILMWFFFYLNFVNFKYFLFIFKVKVMSH